ncbi:MAG: sulfatase-like hydrolase/transferase, partial [Opitutae bacterium]|nr:sulfatase-like hydrolase/transferase [Opitutae bacterium]
MKTMLTLLAFAALSIQAKEPRKNVMPNIVLILADDMGKDSVSAFNGKLGFKTPRMDQLVAQGMTFTEAHSGSALCTPTRYGLLTGRYAWRSRLKRGVVMEWEVPLIEEGRLTLAGTLKRKG